MKKFFAVFAAVCTAAFCFTACDSGNGGKKYDALNEMLGADYSALSLTVTDEIDGITLTSQYAMTFSDDEISVQYSVERLAAIGDLSGAQTQSAKQKLSGTAVIRGGEVAETTGDDVGLSSDIAETSFTFKEEFFENAKLTDTSLKADVKKPSEFLGTAVTCTDMKVEASFAEVFSEITVTYSTANGGKVEFLYKFTV